MSSIRGRDTRPEMLVRRYLHAAGLRYQLGGAGLPGRPDLVFGQHRVAVFVHGCFWHRHPNCKDASNPSSNVQFWTQKLTGNVARDKANRLKLFALSWTPLVVWECQSEVPEELDRLFWKIVAAGTEVRQAGIPRRSAKAGRSEGRRRC
jgi:DNA mismatch endonuclease (patch repair protein)